MTINFARVQAYLNAIAGAANGDITFSPHKDFWNVDYATFQAGMVPHVTCPPGAGGQPIPNLAPGDRMQSAFNLILRTAAGFCTMPQMPAGGPFITDNGYSVNVNGVNVTGQQILDDLRDWLQKGAPEL
jgi:hypothetical protein